MIVKQIRLAKPRSEVAVLCQKELTQSLLEDANGMGALIMYELQNTVVNCWITPL
jgi:hypothetical protein